MNSLNLTHLLFWLALVAVPLTMAFARTPGWLAMLVMAALAALALVSGAFAAGVLAGVVALALVVCVIPIFSRSVLTGRLFTWFRKVMPAISATEREALESGTVWFDAELFSGRPDWRRLLDAPAAALSAEEQAFLDGPVEALCQVLDEWQINHHLQDLPPAAWELIRKHRFFSMIIPREYGGLGFSAQGNGAVVTKIASRNLTAATTIMVPNSLGPGELLHYFGTDEQKRHYLPRLASCEDIPCFALTSPLAGSDAASMPDHGIVCKGQFEGREVLGLRLSFDKRYITLAPVATLVGLAFRAFDPDHLLGTQESLGITCALIPADTPGLELGPRHLPGGAIFMNGPVRGSEIFIPLDWVIGGPERIGQGWRMLMHCLSAGRAISLPALSVANAKMASLMSGAYARIRYQFKQPIGHFEGIEEPLARIAGEAFRMEAAHRVTLAALDQGQKPSVLSAILKANLTEANRRVLNDAMDIHGGKAVVEGPRNYLACAWQSAPVAITVEGANILTRTMIIFGQGAIRCHPWLLKEMSAAGSQAPEAASQFDRAVIGHLGYMVSNLVRAPVLALTGGRLGRTPGPRSLAPWIRRINRLAVAFCLIADVTLLVLGGKFKFAEKLSGRLADALSHLYLASTAVKRFVDEGTPDHDRPLFEWAIADSLHRIEEALIGVLENFPSRVLGRVLRALCFPLGRGHRPPGDALGKRIAQALLGDTAMRHRLAQGVYLSAADDSAGVTHRAFAAVLASAEAEHAVFNAFKKQVTPVNCEKLTARAVASGILSEEQAQRVCAAQRLSAEVIAVDEFGPERHKGEPSAAHPASNP